MRFEKDPWTTNCRPDDLASFNRCVRRHVVW